MLIDILNWIMPVTCFVCGFHSKKYICPPCNMELPRLINPCSLCGLPLNVNSSLRVCGECLIDPAPFDIAFMLFRYDYPIRSIIQKFKFHQKLYFARPLGLLLADFIQERYTLFNRPLPQCIIPVPLHKKRLITRGYNQAMELARPLSKVLGVKIDCYSVQRVIATTPQTYLTAIERQKNVANAFEVKQSCYYHHVALLDDVATTFNTLSEISRLLRKHGIKQIDVWCLAKA